MTKQEELAVWRNLCDALDPETTYSGKWAREQLIFLIKTITSDVEPDTVCLSMWEANSMGEDILERAKKEAERITSRAKEEAERITSMAKEKASMARGRASYALDEAAKAVARIAGSL